MTILKNNNLPTNEGFFGNYGGQYINSETKQELDNLYSHFLKLKDNKDFQNEIINLYKNYSGRPTPTYFAKNLSNKYNAQIFLKREDLNHTGAHKLNHSLGEVLLAKKMGKTKIIAETGAGQHGVAIATACALLNMQCDIYMGSIDIQKERPNVDRMKILGANIISVTKGTQTLKEAVDEAFLAFTHNLKDSFYAIGSVVGPHPFPTIVEYFQTTIGVEARHQFLEQTQTLPDYVIACVGGGSNAIGIFNGFIDDKDVKLIGIEPLGKSSKIGENAASITYGKEGILHGFKCLVLQNEDGSIAPAYSVASGLDYPGVGPKHCHLNQIKRAKYETISDIEAINAFYELSQTEGIILALESSHALAYALKLAKIHPNSKILVNISGRGDKDIDFVLKNYPKQRISKC